MDAEFVKLTTKIFEQTNSGARKVGGTNAVTDSTARLVPKEGHFRVNGKKLGYILRLHTVCSQ